MVFSSIQTPLIYSLSKKPLFSFTPTNNNLTTTTTITIEKEIPTSRYYSLNGGIGERTHVQSKDFSPSKPFKFKQSQSILNFVDSLINLLISFLYSNLSNKKMPSKLRKAIGAVKDQTSISLAKVSSNNSSNLDVAVLKATTHDEVPVDERYVNEVLLLTSSNKIYAAACAHAIAKRIGRTRNWIVALKSLMLVLRLFQDGDPYFPREVLHVMKRGAKILNLSNFRDDSNSSPWDYTAFVRTYALYLDERLNCFLMGKLQRRAVLRDRLPSQRRKKHSNEHVRDMKPAMLLDRISYWQRLLERALATRPTGAAKTNRLIQISLYSVVRESFDLYRDISDGLALLLDSFFHLQYQSCVEAFQTCVKASKQFEELCGFYTLCRGIGVGRTSEYPSVQKISDELIETLQEFLKDQSSFPSGSARTVQGQLLLPAPPNHDETASSTQHDTYERDSDMGSVSLEDLFSVTDAGTSPSVSFSISMDQDQLSEQLDKQSCFQDDFMTSPNLTGTSPSISVDQREGSVLDLAGFFDDQTSQHEEKQQEASVSGSSAREGWELELAECANNISSTCVSNISSTHEAANNGFDSSLLDSLYASHQTPITPHQHTYSNPFLSSDMDMSMAITPVPQHERHYSSSPAVQHDHYSSFPGVNVHHHDHFSSFPTFQAAPSTPPTFSAQNPNDIINDPFATYSPKTRDQSSDGSMNQQHLIQEQQLWLQNQNKIIARHIS